MSDIVVMPIEKIKKKCLCCGEEMELFFQTIYAEYIDKHLMYKIINTMKRYSPYLEDGENPIVSLKYENIMGEIKFEQSD